MTRARKSKVVSAVLSGTPPVCFCRSSYTRRVQDRDGVKPVLEKARPLFSRLHLIRADSGYAGQLMDRMHGACGWILEIVKRNPDVQGLRALPQRRLSHARVASL